MDEQSDKKNDEASPVPRHRHIGFWLLIGLVAVALFLSIAVLGMTGRVVRAPDWVVERVEARANGVLAESASVRVLDIELLVDERFVPHVRLTGVELFSPRGARIAVLPDLRTALQLRPLLGGRVEPKSLTIAGTRIALRRLPDGSMDLDVGTNVVAEGGALEPAEILNAIDEAFSLPVLKDIETVTVDGLDLRFDDIRSGRSWSATDGWMTLNQDAERISIELAVSLAEEGRAPAQATMSFHSEKGSPEATVSAEFTDVSARDLAAQSPALAWLGALDAPISGSIKSAVDAEGRFAELDATLAIGSGALQPTTDTKPVRFDQVRLDLAYDAEDGRLTFKDMIVDGPALRVRADAKGWLKDFEGGLPNTLVGQVAIKELKADPEGIFADAVTIKQGALDFRLRLDPFIIDLGQLVLVDEGGKISARGKVTAAPEGWAVSVDAAVDAIESSRLMALWPVSAVPKTRAWLEQNVATSKLFDVKAAFRTRPGQTPRFSLGYEYRDTEVRVIKTLPPILNGAGYATIEDNAYALVVDRGHVIAPSGGWIDVAGTVMKIPDLRIKPAPAEFTLRTDSTITAALSLLDQPPFQFLTKAGRSIDLAEGRAEVEAILNLSLTRKILPGDVDYSVTARLTDVRSEKMVPGRFFSAGALDLRATTEGLEISGPATFSGVPVDAAWKQGFSPDQKGKSTVAGTVELSQRFLDTFGIALPKGSVGGKGSGRITLDLEKGKPAEFRLESNLAGMTLSVPQIGWSKPAGTEGKLMVSGRLGKPAEVNRFELDASGLSASGNIVLSDDGGLEVVRLGVARIGNWFDGQAQLRGRGKGRPVGVVVQGGRADMRRARIGGGSGGQSGAPLSVVLDRLQISEGIAVTDFRGEFTTGAGLTGDFTGRINGAAPVTGTVAPVGSRSGYRIRSADAGAAMRAAGIFARGVGGQLDLVLRPSSAAGSYDGKASIRDIRVVDAPVLAELLDAVSVVGLLSQLSGPGILFGTVEGDFHLTPNAVEIRNGSAVGPSLGISADGIYQTTAKQIDLQGTVSPIYMLNGIGQIFSRRGEGLFGFNYRMTGNADDPRVSVNPLSILTPGMFREIFRSNPPKIDR